ncbi:nibrin homolog isoform X5 [Lycium ferocissimum]|uniref:nibrin homolog isoform X5 n=1 Tax=Lycium ferocissimum TaxID=112874 RepID=UPI00281577D5|nr:nibrin homolog isoform X5 [Lycium ferocissimum]
MVWGLFPIDPLPGEDNYYFFNKGAYKVGRKGCDVIVNKDKGVSRIHAEILIDEMISLDHSLKKPSNILSKVRIKDCSKYGTFLNKDLDSKEKVHEFPNKETMLKDGDLVSFGTGNATYRFSYVSFIFFICSPKHSKTNQLITKKVSSIGATITKKWSLDCSHVLVDDSFPLTEDLIDAIVARKPLVQYSWVEYKFEGRLQSILEVGGANVSSAEMALEKNGNDRLVCVVPAGSSSFKCFSNQSSLPSVSEIDLVSAVLSAYLDPSLITSPPVLVTSSCSTDETVVADSDAETESAKSDHIAAAVCSIESSEHESKRTTSPHKLESVEYYNENKCSVQIVIPSDNASMRDTSPSSTKPGKRDGGHIPHDDATIHDPEGGYIRRLGVKSDNTVAKEDITDERENGKLDIIYSQDLIVRDSIMSLPVSSSTNGGVTNFKRFRKTNAPPQNSFEIFIPFSKYPYQESECKNEDVAESIKEEKKRKQMEAVAEDLFNSEKGRRHGVAGSLHGLFARR